MPTPAKPPADPATDQLTDEELEEFRAFQAARASQGRKPGRGSGDNGSGQGGSTVVLPGGATMSYAEMEKAGFEGTLRALDMIRAEDASKEKDAKIAELEAAVEAAKKVERKPAIVGWLTRLLWGEPREPLVPDEAAQGQGK